LAVGKHGASLAQTPIESLVEILVWTGRAASATMRRMNGNEGESTTRKLEVPGAVLTYDVRSHGPSNEPVLLLAGWPMGASGFAALVTNLTDRTVVTYDPRGVERSVRTDDARKSNPDMNADDLHHLIGELGAGPVDFFGTSGGAINGLALVARHKNDVRVLIAHEPPLASVLPDREAAVAAMRDIEETYMRSGFGPGMAKFIALASHRGPIPADFVDQPAPNPQMFGLPVEDNGLRDDVLLQNFIGDYELDFDSIGSAPTRIVVVAGDASEGELANRGAHAVADRLGTEPIIFPGGHGGFMDEDYGRTGQPDKFAAKLLEVLSQGA
jgi:pimeloyl-ACP methyl ester carboxylesterase